MRPRSQAFRARERMAMRQKRSMLIRTFASVAAALLLHIFPVGAHALGVQPETSVVIVQESEGEGKMIVLNTEDRALLLHSTLRTLPGSAPGLLVLTPPVARLEGGKKQLVRFVLRPHEPLEVQQMQRVVFEGIPQAASEAGSVEVTVRQDLPVIINPKGLKLADSPWEQLRWTTGEGGLEVFNPSPYVVRLSQQIDLSPDKVSAELPRPYVLPGERLRIDTGAVKVPVKTVKIFPASMFGYAVDAFEAPVGNR